MKTKTIEKEIEVLEKKRYVVDSIAMIVFSIVLLIVYAFSPDMDRAAGAILISLFWACIIFSYASYSEKEVWVKKKVRMKK